jgi:hypothetical protein
MPAENKRFNTLAVDSPLEKSDKKAESDELHQPRIP